jgi:hypothetical protein
MQRRITRCLSLAAVAFLSYLGCSDDSGDDHVGSRDCAAIVAASPDPATGEACSKCQGKTCGTTGCEHFPCVDGAVVVQGCNEDADCTALPNAPFCGKHSAPDKVCVDQDDI